MEGLENGWIKSGISGKYHYTRRCTINRDGLTVSACGFKTRKFSDILKKFEILDTSLICVTCELQIKQYADNFKKKAQLARFPTIQINNSHVLKHVICSELGCNESGGSYVSIIDKEKPHYCIKHNLRVQETIRKEKKLEIIS